MSKQDSILYQFARDCGVDTAYHNAMGHYVEATEIALLSVLQRLGIAIERPEQAEELWRQYRLAKWQRPIEPVTVSWDGKGHMSFQGSHQLEGQSYRLTVQMENGESRQIEGKLQHQNLLHHETLDGHSYDRWSIQIPGLTDGKEPSPLPSGYHHLSLEVDGETHTSMLFSAPRQVYVPWKGSDEKYWGAFLPLYALQKENGSFGPTGHLGDLQALIQWIAEEGGHMVGTLPMLAAYLDWPCEPSPYTPASRLFWNALYLNLEAIPEWNKAAQQAYQDAASNQPDALAYQPEYAPKNLRQGPFSDKEVHHFEEMRHKRAALKVMAEEFFSGPSANRAAFDAWMSEHDHLGTYAHFRTMMEQQQAPWSEWPQGWDVQEAPNPKALQYHLYVQWNLHCQLTELAEQTPPNSLGLYLDLPLGVHPFGFDTWHYPHAFCQGLGTGAPPDALQIRGQNWGFPPLHPQKLRDNQYDYLIETYRNHMQYAGVLRIDHVMGLYRLFVIPDGLDATDGVYIRFQQEELYAVLSLESHRNQCLLLGEDLGTVPNAVEEAMSDHDVQRMHVIQFAMEPNPEAALDTPATNCIASLNTHDTPTYTGFWHGQDLKIGRELGLYTANEMAQNIRERRLLHDAIALFLQREGFLAPEAWVQAKKAGTEDRAFTQATLEWLAQSDARMALVNLEDLWQEEQPQNVPGTSNERPNWRKRAAYTLEQMQQLPAVKEALQAFAKARPNADEKEPKKAHPKPPKAHLDFARQWPTNIHPQTWQIGSVKQIQGWLTHEETYLFSEGTYTRMYQKFGAHEWTFEGEQGTHFLVWAPNASCVSVIADFNEWDASKHPLHAKEQTGLWEGFIPGACPGSLYKYHIASKVDGQVSEKADPVGFLHECPPQTASHIWDLAYLWNDTEWMGNRKLHNHLDAPISIYEVHLGSWMRPEHQPNGSLSYRQMAHKLAEYVGDLGYTHVQLMPITEHPFYGSWGYQTTGYFAPTARYGTPQDFMYLVDTLHQSGIGVFLDWVPSHFPNDAHGLAHFDGTALYEHEDPRQGFHPDWNSCIFNYGRHEVRSFLLSSAIFWLDQFHIDGLRVDAVASMLYLDYSRKEGEWLPNVRGGRENLEAIHFLRQLNDSMSKSFPDTLCTAEESTSWPQVTHPTQSEGLGFDLKWDMGWMHDTLGYIQRETIHRKFHHNELTFRSLYALQENFVLALSHDEVVHGKGSLLRKMPGDDWQKRANLRLLYGYMYAQSGKKLLFMGGELAMWAEWNHEGTLPWHQLENPDNRAFQNWIRTLNRIYREEPALYDGDFDPSGLIWLEANDAERSIYCFMRSARLVGNSPILAIFNFTPVVRYGYRIGVPQAGAWVEIANSDGMEYGGSDIKNTAPLHTEEIPSHHQEQSLSLTLPPLGMLFLKRSNTNT